MRGLQRWRYMPSASRVMSSDELFALAPRVSSFRVFFVDGVRRVLFFCSRPPALFFRRGVHASRDAYAPRVQ